MMISDNPTMRKQTELLIRSIKLFSKGKPTAFSLVIQGFEKSSIKKPLILPKIDYKYKYLSSATDVYYCPYYWELGAPCRWFIEPKMDMCVLIDVDMIACNDLSSLYELDKDTIHGVTAFNTTKLRDKEWESIGVERKNYFNFGMIVVPSKYLHEIGNKLFDVYPEMSKKFNNYYSGQISLAYIMKNMKKNILPQKFNWYDKLPFEGRDKIIFLHYFSKSKEYKKIINDVSESVFNVKYI